MSTWESLKTLRIFFLVADQCCGQTVIKICGYSGLESKQNLKLEVNLLEHRSYQHEFHEYWLKILCASAEWKFKDFWIHIFYSQKNFLECFYDQLMRSEW